MKVLLTVLFCLCVPLMGAEIPTPLLDPDELLKDVKGYLVQPSDAKGSILGGRPKSGTRIVAMSLPSRTEKTIHTLQRGPKTHSLSGPDESGRVAYLEDYFFVPDAEKRHLLKCVSLKDDKETTIFTKPGSAMWATSAVQTSNGHGVIGTYLALAPSGGNIALLSRINDRQMPGALLHEGHLEIWNLVRKKKVKIAEIKALNQPMAWFPNGNRLAYVKLTPIKQIPENGVGSELLDSYVDRKWEGVPAIFSLDLKTGKSAFLAVGWQPAISPDAKTLIVTGSKKLYSVDLATGKAADLDLPKVAYRTWDPTPVVIGIAEDGTVFHRGLPLTGKRAKTTTGNSPLVGRKPMLTVRAANPATGKSVVVIPYFDLRHRISFGIPARKEKVLGAYERKVGEYTARLVFLEKGIFKRYYASKELKSKWKIVGREIHVEYRGNIVYRINKDGIITGPIAQIDEDGKRKDLSKDEQLTFKKIK